MAQSLPDVGDTCVEGPSKPAWGDLATAEPVPADQEEAEVKLGAPQSAGDDGAAEKRTAAMEAAAAGLVAHPECIQATTINEEPRMVHFMNFVSPEEAAHLLELAEGRWIRSTVTRGSRDKLHGEKAEKPKPQACSGNGCEAAEAEDGVEVVSDGCTSRTVRLDYEESSVVERVLGRVAHVTGHPLENVEPLVLVRYGPGEVFRLHHDGAMRPMTVFIYLNDVASGGETSFPVLGLNVQPVLGTAVMWSNTLEGNSGPDAVADRRMDHEALPPGEGCIKYAMNCFVNCYPQRDCSHIHLVSKTS